MKRGFIKLWRKIQDHPDHPSHQGREYTEFEAWIDLIMLVNFEPNEWNGMTVNRGETAMSLQNLATRWKWSKSKVFRYLERKKKGGEIEIIDVEKAKQQPKRSSKRIKVINYDTYNPNRNEERNANRNVLKEVKEDKNIYAAFFDNFWKNYPTRNGRKVGKKECAAYVVEKKKIKPEQFDDVLTATKNYSREAGKYAKDPIRFLKNDFWRDYITGPSNGRMVI